MASKLQIKKSSETGKVPQPADLDWGELAINYTDGKLFYKQNGSNSIQEINTPATGAAAHKTWASLGSNGAAARRHTIARVYGTPNHWVESWQNIRIKVVQEGYSSGYLEYNLIGYYGMGNGASWLLRLKDADGFETGNFQVTLGTPTAAGWDYAGQPTYYQDVYVEVAYYLTVRVVATTYGHGFQTANPTDGSSGCYTVFYNTPAITDGITYSTASQTSTYHFDNKIWNAGNDGANSGLDADLLDGNHASAFALASHSHSYLPLSGGELTGTLTVQNSGTFNKARIYTSDDNAWYEQIKNDGTIVGRIGFDGYSSASLYYTEFNLAIRGQNDSELVNILSVNSTRAISLSGTGLTYNGNVIINASNKSSYTFPPESHTHSYLPLSGGTLTGTLQHNGLTMSVGTGVDQVYTHQQNITLTTAWQDTGVNAAELATGSYIIQVTSVDDFTVGGQQYSEYYTGVMSWYSDNTNSTVTDEIVLHRAGHAPNGGTIFLRVARTPGADTDDIKLQIAGTTNNSAAYQYTFKFRRLI